MDRNDREILEGRKNPLDGVEVNLRERSLQKLVKKLEDLGEGNRTVDIWNRANNDRMGHLQKQQALLQEFDEFIEPIYTKSQDWMSDLHLPVIFTACKTYHARFLSALMSIDPPFSLKARQAAYEDRAPVVQDVMRYALMSWANNYRGVEEAIDQWLWRWITAGQGILKQRWVRKFERYVDVVERQVVVSSYDTVDPQTGENVTVPTTELQEVEEEVVETVFDGPGFEVVPEEDIVIVGGDGDPQEADDVIQSLFLPASELWSLSDQKVFREEAVKEVIKSGETLKSTEQANAIKMDQASSAGINGIDKSYDLERYQILERYARVDVDGSGITAEIILWVHKETAKILRATYLRRVSKSGMRPFSKIEFHRRNTREYPVGLPELLYSLAKEIDAITNIKLDIGIQTSLPMGFYRPTSSTNDEIISYGPGQLIPLDNPGSDVFFPNFGNRTAFAFQEENFLLGQVERITSMSDLNFGLQTSQGAARTATGARALLGESNANLDVFLRRLNRGWKHALTYLFHQLQDKIQPGFEFRIFGDDGKSYFRRIESKQELCGMYDFELEANSANSNQAVRQEVANQLVMLTGNPLDIQLGIITPLERFEALKNLLLVSGVRDYGKFLRKPNQPLRIFSPIEVANRVLAGQDVPFGPEQDLAGFVSWFERVINEDELLGQFDGDQTVALFRKYQEAQAMMQAIAQQQSQFANQQQVAINSAMSTGAPQPTPQTPAAVNPAAS